MTCSNVNTYASLELRNVGVRAEMEDYASPQAHHFTIQPAARLGIDSLASTMEAASSFLVWASGPVTAFETALNDSD